MFDQLIKIFFVFGHDIPFELTCIYFLILDLTFALSQDFYNLLSIEMYNILVKEISLVVSYVEILSFTILFLDHVCMYLVYL